MRSIMSGEPKKVYTVTAVREEAPGVRTLELAVEDSTSFHAGQFITVYFPELNVPEGKAYSLSAAPFEQRLTITVKAMGEFSNRLCNIHIGNSFLGSEPYGFFYSEERETPLVLLAIGIGVTPFRSLILETLQGEPDRKLLLCYGSRTCADIIFRETWESTAKMHTSFRVVHFLSREEAEGMERGRMSAERILPLIEDVSNAEFMLCGSIAFVRDLWKGLCSAGVGEERIYTEAFFTN